MPLLTLKEFQDLQQKRTRLFGLDLGSKTIGIALSDDRWTIATPYKVLERTKFSKDTLILQDLMKKEGVVGLVLGLPINMDGSEGPRAQSTRDFSKNIEESFSVPLLLWDERLTTVQAERVLIEADLSRKKRGKIIDKMAATLILQNALDALENLRKERGAGADSFWI